MPGVGDWWCRGKKGAVCALLGTIDCSFFLCTLAATESGASELLSLSVTLVLCCRIFLTGGSGPCPEPPFPYLRPLPRVFLFVFSFIITFSGKRGQGDRPTFSLPLSVLLRPTVFFPFLPSGSSLAERSWQFRRNRFEDYSAPFILASANNRDHSTDWWIYLYLYLFFPP